MSVETVTAELLFVRNGHADERAWPVVSFTMDEALNDVFAIHVTVQADEEAVRAVDEDFVFVFSRGSFERRVPCMLEQVRITERFVGGERIRAAELTLRPGLWRLRRRVRSRIFAGMTTRAIAEEIAALVGTKLHGRTYDDRLRDYRVQYREDTLTFLRRMLAADGVGWRITANANDVEQLMLYDSNAALGLAVSVPVASRDSASESEAIWYVEEVLQDTGHQALRQRDWDWRSRPRALQETYSSVRCPPDRRDVVDEGREPDRADGRHTDLALHHKVHGLNVHGNVCSMRPGTVIRLDAADYEARPLVVDSVTHRGNAGKHLGEVQYNCSAALLPLHIQALPVPWPAPRAGLQMAVVVGPRKGEPHVDEFGRICVRMLWDDEDAGAETWLRVITPWAGDAFGTMFAPRVGMEVAVDFLHGDPDRPICIGCVYGGESAPPEQLPTNAARAVIRSDNLRGTGYHELSMDDTQGAEELHIRAQRRLREVVAGLRSSDVSGDDRTTVGGNLSADVAKSRSTFVTENDTHRVGRNAEITVGGAFLHQIAGGDESLDAGAKVDVVRGSYDLHAKDGITLRCGESVVAVLPGEILITSPRVRVAAADTHLQMQGSVAHMSAPHVELQGAVSQLVLDNGAALRCARTQSAVIIDGGDVKIFGVASAEVTAPAIDCKAGRTLQLSAPTLTADAEAMALSSVGIGLTASGGVDVIASRDLVMRGQKIRLN